MKRDKWLIVALLVSVGVNVWLALQLRELRRREPNLRQLEKVEQMLAQLRNTRALPPMRGEATLAVRLGDCSSCFDFLSQFASVCAGNQEACEVMLVEGSSEHAEQLAERYALSLKVVPRPGLPEELPVRETPVVWVKKRGKLAFVEKVPVDPFGQLRLVLSLQQVLSVE